jgi:hypothetical protein
MAEKNVTVQVLGGGSCLFGVDEVPTVGAAKAKMMLPNYTASCNGEPADDDDEVSEFSFISLNPSVKGGC